MEPTESTELPTQVEVYDLINMELDGLESEVSPNNEENLNSSGSDLTEQDDTESSASEASSGIEDPEWTGPSFNRDCISVTLREIETPHPENPEPGKLSNE